MPCLDEVGVGAAAQVEDLGREMFVPTTFGFTGAAVCFFLDETAAGAAVQGADFCILINEGGAAFAPNVIF